MSALQSSAAKVDAVLAQRKDDGVVLVNGSDIRPEPIRWLWKDWLPLGKLVIMAGAPGQGKTTLLIAIAATVSIGGKWPDGTRCAAGNVLIWSGEDDPADTLLPRLLAAGADPARVYFVTGSKIDGEALPFDPARDMLQLTEAAGRIGNVKMLMVDPVVSAVTGDSHKNTEVRRALQPLVDLGQSLDCLVAGVSHFGKGGQGREPTERVVGSVAFGAVARVVMVVAKTTSAEGVACRLLARSKSNIGPEDGGFQFDLEQIELVEHPGVHASRVKWGAAVEGTARELLAEAEAVDAGDDAGHTATDEAVESLKLILNGDTVPSKSVKAQMAAEGYTEKVTRTARERIGVVVSRTGSGKEMVSYWKLPDALVPIRAHTCPVDREGTNGHERQNEGTNAEPPSCAVIAKGATFDAAAV